MAISEEKLQRKLNAEPENQSLVQVTLDFTLRISIVIVSMHHRSLEMRQHWGEPGSTSGGADILDSGQTFRFHGSEYAGKEELHRSLEMGNKRLLA